MSALGLKLRALHLSTQSPNRLRSHCLCLLKYNVNNTVPDRCADLAGTPTPSAHWSYLLCPPVISQQLFFVQPSPSPEMSKELLFQIYNFTLKKPKNRLLFATANTLFSAQSQTGWSRASDFLTILLLASHMAGLCFCSWLQWSEYTIISKSSQPNNINQKANICLGALKIVSVIDWMMKFLRLYLFVLQMWCYTDSSVY